MSALKTHNILLLLLAAGICWFAVEFLRFRSETLGSFVPPESVYHDTTPAPDTEPDNERPDIQLNNDTTSRIIEMLEDYSRRQLVGDMLDDAGILSSEDMINLYIAVSEELGMASDEEIRNQIELTADYYRNLERMDIWAYNAALAADNGAEADEFLVDDILASYEILKIAFPTTEFSDELIFGARFLISLAILYETINEDMDLIFEEMQFYWRTSVLMPIMLGYADYTFE